MKLLAVFILNILKIGISIGEDPPLTWQEHWFEHNQLLKRVYFDNEVAVYFDNDVNKTITWPFQYLHDVWVYTNKLYGCFNNGTDNGRLFAIFHTSKYGGGHPSTYFDASHDYRNVIDNGLLDPHAWETQQDIAIPTHEIGHIVEGASHGVHNSPAFNIWGDSKWNEIYIYDIYLALGRTSDAQTWYNQMIVNHDNFPKDPTYWFRDWFYPIYNNYGGSQVLNNFFLLLSKYFPKNNGASFGRPQYTRDMNHGEFIHFWSGAANHNLISQATLAFGSTLMTTYQSEYQKALLDFPLIKY